MYFVLCTVYPFLVNQSWFCSNFFSLHKSDDDSNSDKLMRTQIMIHIDLHTLCIYIYILCVLLASKRSGTLHEASPNRVGFWLSWSPDGGAVG